MNAYFVRNPLTSQWLSLEGPFEYARWVDDPQRATALHLWKAAALADFLKPVGQFTNMEIVRGT